MSPPVKGLLVLALHLALIGSLGAKLLIDRQIRPRVWAEVVPFDPDLPIRGRYVSLRVKATARGFPDVVEESWVRHDARLSAEDGRLIATRTEPGGGELVRIDRGEGGPVALLETPVAYFIPEHVPDPSSTPGLMAEVTLPRQGGPRPIRLGVRQGDRVVPLDL